MMSDAFEAPRFDELRDRDLQVEHGDEPWVIAVSATASDVDMVTVTWDHVARSAHVRWTRHGVECVVIERETVFKVSIWDIDAGLQFEILTRSEGLQGTLQVTVGAEVTVRDAILRA